MATSNPYAQPAAALADPEDYSDISVFSSEGRIGRVRYIGYLFGLYILFAVAIVLLGMLLGGGTLGTVVMGIGYLAMLVIMFMLTIQRAHDFNASGWLSLLVLVPLVQFIFWIIPGTDGENRFGKMTPPNKGWEIALSLIVPVLFVVGIIAAISIPAYQNYVKRAQEAQQQSQQQPQQQSQPRQ